jgi:hypothetical protein
MVTISPAVDAKRKVVEATYAPRLGAVESALPYRGSRRTRVTGVA